jgi:hypothetical protein
MAASKLPEAIDHSWDLKRTPNRSLFWVGWI